MSGNPSRHRGASATERSGRSPRVFLDDVGRAKGLGIILVVVGHLAARQIPEGNEWYRLLKLGIYQFHMPFFMYLSGLVAFHSGSMAFDRQTYLVSLRKGRSGFSCRSWLSGWPSSSPKRSRPPLRP